MQDNVFFSVDITCTSVPTVQWTFMSAAVSRLIATWQPGLHVNVTQDYGSRVLAYPNGSMGLRDLRLQDAGYYVVTVTDTAGSSRDAGFVLKVNGEELVVVMLLVWSGFNNPRLRPQRCCMRISTTCSSRPWPWPLWLLCSCSSCGCSTRPTRT